MTAYAFILGAGFNADAALETGKPTMHGNVIKYPVVSDLAKKCFEFEELPPGKSIEELFQESIINNNNNNLKPVDRLNDLIMEADFYIAPSLQRSGQYPNNVYLRFLKDFSSAPLITFNYDSLPELLLFSLGVWRPDSGYGVPVKVATINGPPSPPEGECREVLHLHGSLCVYPIISEIESGTLKLKQEPTYCFAPEELEGLFHPFKGVLPGHGYTDVSNRVVAPIPDKAKELQKKFITTVYCKAIDRIRQANELIVIGYSFNPHDYASYAGLLEAAVGRRIRLVAPDARSLVNRLANNHSSVSWEPIPLSFRDWVHKDYQWIR